MDISDHHLISFSLSLPSLPTPPTLSVTFRRNLCSVSPSTLASTALTLLPSIDCFSHLSVNCATSSLFSSLTSSLPPPPSSLTADDFTSFFSSKIADIHRLFNTPPSSPITPKPPTNQASFSSCLPLSDAEVSALLLRHKPTMCALDPLPSHLFQATAPDLLPFISSLLNSSLLSGCFPVSKLSKLRNKKHWPKWFNSAPHKTYSRIDYIITSSTLTENKTNINILPILLSHHSPVICNITPTLRPPPMKCWRFYTFLLQNSEFITKLNCKLQEFIQFNQSSAMNPQILWEVTKCFLRGNCTAFSSHLHISRNKQITTLETQIQNLEKEQKQAFSDARAKQLNILKTEFKDLTLSRAEFLIHCSKQKYYYFGERPSRLLDQSGGVPPQDRDSSFASSFSGFDLFGMERKMRKPTPRNKQEPKICVFCRNNGAPEEVYGSHVLKTPDGRVVCPILRAYTCPLCSANGDNAHTIKYCPLSKDQPAQRPLKGGRAVGGKRLKIF
ncbi:NANO1 protein, partial [Amia calva]|nr:NANO1 protein [Amia calva]